MYALFERIAKERDHKKFLELVKELNSLLERREKQLGHTTCETANAPSQRAETFE